MIHLKYECKVNFVKLPLIWIYQCLKLIFENATAGRNTGCRLVVNRVGSSLSPHALGTTQVARQLIDAVHTRACMGIKKQ